MRGSLAPSSLTPMAQPFKKVVIAAFGLIFIDQYYGVSDFFSKMTV